MKLFKRIYYPVVGILALVALIFSFIDASYGGRASGFEVNAAVEFATRISQDPHSIDHRTAHDAVRDAIVAELGKTYNIPQADNIDRSHVERGTVNDASYHQVDGKNVPTFVVQKAEMTYANVATYFKEQSLGIPEVRDYKIDNIIVAFPAATSNADTLLITAHYDSFGETVGAAETGVPVAAMLANIKKLIDEKPALDNNVVFLFADYGNFENLGLTAFRNNFEGFGKISTSVDLIVTVANAGTEGSVILYETRNTDYEFVKSYAKVGNSARVNSLFEILAAGRFSAPSPFVGPASVTFLNIGKGENYKTRNDNADNISVALTAQHIGLVSNIVEKFGNEKLTALKANNRDTKLGVYFTFLSFMTVHYPIWCSFMFAGLLLAMLIPIIILNIKKKAFSFVRLGIGSAVAVLGALAAVAGVFLGYNIFGALAAGFGIITFRGLSAGIAFSNSGIFAGAMLLGTACAIAAYIFFKWLFNVKVMDVIRGNALVVALVAAIVGFASPQAGFVLMWLAFAELIIMLLLVIFRDKFRARFGMDMDRLFLPVIPMIIFAPVVVTNLLIVAQLVGAAYYSLIAGVFALFIGFIAPYFAYLKPVFQKIADKMPERTVRKQTLVAEQTPHPSKKGKFVETMVKKNFEEKVPRKYAHWVGVSAVAIISAVTLIACGFFGSNSAKNLTYARGDIMKYYDDSLVYSIQSTHSGTFSVNSAEWRVFDRDVYNYVLRRATDFEFNESKNAYIREEVENINRIAGPTISTSTSGNVKTISITPSNSASGFTFRLKSTSGISEITVSEIGRDSYTKKFIGDSDVSLASEITLALTGTTTIEIVGKSAVYSGSAAYTERSRSKLLFQNYTEEIRSMIAELEVLYELNCEVTV